MAVTKQFSIIDEGLTKSSTGNISVSIEITEHSLAVVCFDRTANKFSAFESWLSEERNSLPLFEKISDSLILNANPSDIRISLLTDFAVIIPAELFLPEHVSVYLDYTVTKGRTGKASYDDIAAQQAFCCYLIPESFSELANQLRTTPKFSHFTSSFITEITHKINSEQKTIVVFFHEHAFEIACLHQNKLIQYNSFAFHTVQEYLYFLLQFIQQSNLDTETVNCIVTGGIEEKSALMQATLKYIRNVEHLLLTGDNMFSEIFDSIPKNRYDILFQLASKQ